MIRHHLPAVLLVEVDMRAVLNVWVIALDLLADGLRFPSGLGDVFVCRVPGTALVEIVANNGAVRVAVQVHHDDLTGFVQAVQQAAQTSEAAP